ncbi:MAG: hypothetical protein HYR49_01255 [Gammaproteobacteria bacterium]|nr:hypothetical protein [Gammaproteobacteria bacterium]
MTAKCPASESGDRKPAAIANLLCGARAAAHAAAGTPPAGGIVLLLPAKQVHQPHGVLEVIPRHALIPGPSSACPPPVLVFAAWSWPEPASPSRAPDQDFFIRRTAAPDRLLKKSVLDYFSSVGPLIAKQAAEKPVFRQPAA